MSAEERPAHAVLVRAVEGFVASKVAGVLAKRAKVPALDMVPVVRRDWGLAARSLPAAEAESLAADLAAAGQDAVAVPASLLEDIPPPVSVTKAIFTADTFELVAGHENAACESLAWARLSLLCAAAVEVKTTATVTERVGPGAGEQAVRMGLTMATGLPLMKKATEVKREVEVRDRRLFLDLVFTGPSRRVRVDAMQFDYSVLGARKGYAAELNFQMLLEDLTSHAPQAVRGRGTRAILSRSAGGGMRYESLDELGREEFWLSNLLALGAAR